MSDYVEVKILEPIYIYEDCPRVAVRDKYLRQAEKENKLLRIECKGKVHFTTPTDWKKTGKIMRKVFNFPDRPMILWENFVVDNDPPKKEEINADNYLENMHKLGQIFRKKVLKQK